ncbi:MAG: sugar kinase [Planctomycetaceae bacterium]|nr:sugar kinase [Planctomycetaceae bacterium]
MPQIITIGEILVEIMAQQVGQTFLTPGLWDAPYPSGAPAIFISQAARFGAGAGIIGCVGADDFGRLNLERLKNDGVDTSAIAISPDRATGCAFVTYRSDGSRSFIYHIPDSAAGQVDIGQINPKWFEDCRYLHVMGSSFSIPGVYEAVTTCAEIVKRSGGKISFDPNIRIELIARDEAMRGRILNIYSQTNLLLPGSDELSLLTGCNDVDESLDIIFATTGIEDVVVKNAAKGCRYANRQERVDVAPFSVEEVDPTGAGDCFAGALVAGLVLGMPTREAVATAAAAGALAVTKKGPMEGASFLVDVKSFMASNAIPVA